MKEFKFKEATEGKIGTVTAVSLPSEFQFQINLSGDKKPIVQDFVVVKHPTDENVPVLSKIVSISRFNPLLPEESTLELAQLNIEPEMTPLPLFGTMEMIGALCKIIGYVGPFGKMRNPGFPIKPGTDVYMPSAKYMQEILSGEDKTDDLDVGSLRNRQDVGITVNGNEILNKHLAVLAMTGAGKTYSVSVIIEALMRKGYPILIIDPHSDYSNIDVNEDGKKFWYKTIKNKRGKYFFKKFQAGIDLGNLTKNEFISFVASLSEEDVSVAQQDVWKKAYNLMQKEKKGINSLYNYLGSQNQNATILACFRQLNSVKNILEGTETTLKIQDIRKSFGLGKGVLLDMSNLPYQMQRITVQLVLQRLFEKRKKFILTKNPKSFVPPVFVIVEEAHNYAPATIEGETFPSRTILRRIATEGRKFGFSLCIVSQRPSRLDSTVLSQCNSQMILKIVNPNDQTYIRSSVESLAETDLKALPDLAQGEALISGSWTPIPSVIQVKQRDSKEGIPAVKRLKEIENM